MTLPELAAAFNINDFGRSSPRFDPKQLLALNRKILHGMSFAQVQDRLPEGAGAEFWLAVRGNLDLLNEARLWWEVVAGEITPPDFSSEAGFIKAALGLLPAEPWGADSSADLVAFRSGVSVDSALSAEVIRARL